MNVTAQQARTRFKTLSPKLQDVVFSVQTAEIIATTVQSAHLPLLKIPLVAEAVGLVLLGFVHPEDLAKEIEQYASIPQPVATELSKAFSAKLFAPIRTDLDATYAPAPDGRGGNAIDLRTMTGLPKLVPDTKRAATPTIGVGTAPTTSTLATSSGMAAPQPLRPVGGITPQTTPPLPTSPLQKPAAGGAPTPIAPPAPAPVMLHREAEFRPIQQAAPSSALKSDILGRQPAGTGAVSMFGGKPAPAGPAAPVSAKIEFGGAGGTMKPQVPTVARTEANIPRVIHYSDMKTPVSPFGAAATGAPQPPRPPIPPPPAPQTGAVVNPDARLASINPSGVETPTLRRDEQWTASSGMPEPAPPTPTQAPRPPLGAQQPPAPAPKREVNYTAPPMATPSLAPREQPKPSMPAPPRPPMPPTPQIPQSPTLPVP